MPIIAFIIGAILLGTGPIGWVILLFGLFCYGVSWLIIEILIDLLMKFNKYLNNLNTK